MLKVYKVDSSDVQPVLINPLNGIYEVVESSYYVLEFERPPSRNSSRPELFLEDIPFTPEDILIKNNTIRTKRKRIFVDYFGLSQLSIDSWSYLFNIKAEKLKVKDIEDMFSFLWEKEEKLFENFFSKSTKNIDFTKKGVEIKNSSKFLSFVEEFLNVFEDLCKAFKYQPHKILREQNSLEDFSTAKITESSIHWLLGNLDTIKHFSQGGDRSSIQLNGKQYHLNKIQVKKGVDTLSVYENSIILGGITFVFRQVKHLIKLISLNINIESLVGGEYEDFRDLKKLPYIKLHDRSCRVEKKCKVLFMKYSNIFRGVTPVIEKPRLTSVFSSKIHYRKAYFYITKMFNTKVDLNGDFQLLNISKLSQLYEVYNFHLLVDAFKAHLDLNLFEVEATTKREDGIIDRISFTNYLFDITVYYEKKISVGEDIDLIRIDKREGDYYNPDHVIELKDNITKEKFYWILDSKYSKKHIVQSYSLNSCMYKYLLNTGIKGKRFDKVEGLALLFPAGSSKKHLHSDFHKPNISLILSKPNHEGCISDFISNLLREYVHKNLLKLNTTSF